MSDPTLEELRDEISAIDRDLVAAVNRRLDLVTQVWKHKSVHSLPVHDPERERQIFEQLAASNAGPLSDEGLHELVRTILALTKSELSPS
jgi:chorismate mutase/prephenate dehydratase